MCLDAGNSGIKWAIKWQGKGNWSEINKLKHTEVDNIPKILKKKKIKVRQILVSSVVEQTEQKLRELELEPQPFFSNTGQINPVLLAYETPKTLGIDRYLACLGARIQSRDCGVVVIDAGTACTIDLMDAKRIYHGGVIMPGLRLFEQGLKNYAKALPEVGRNLPEDYPGKSTQECLKWGITGSFLGAIRYHMNRMAESLDDPVFYATGGDASLLAQHITKPYRLNIDPYLVMKGLVQHYKNVQKG